MKIKKFIRRIQESEWRLGIVLNGLNGLEKGNIKWISNGKYKTKWFADPFILGFNENEIILLVEEFDYKVHRGRLARLIIDRKKWEISDCKIILDLDTHLSFPMIFRDEERIYVLPENYASGGWNLYEYDPISDVLIWVKNVINEKFTDATIYKHDGKYYALTTIEPTPNGNHLEIYSSDSLMGVFSHCQTVEFNDNVARNAGSIFCRNNMLVRPTQECDYSYGHSITFQEVSIEKGLFKFNEFLRYESTNKKYNLGTHTYNEYNGMAVIDVKGYRYKVLGPLQKFVYDLLVMIGAIKRKKME